MTARPAPSILLVGINGFGSYYVNAVLDLQARGEVKIAGLVDPMAAHCERLPELVARGAPVFDRAEDFFADGHRADLTCIASPIQFHCEQSCLALAHGSAVLCEKPLGALLEEADQMESAERESGHFLAIGYQWSFSRAIQALKADIRKGRLGAPRRLKTLVLWPRGSQYYGRNGWAGKIKDGNGRWVLDSPVNNATAHHLHNMLYVLGERTDTSAKPVQLSAELYRANPIESFDSCALRATTEAGAEILFYTSHAVQQPRNPMFVFEFDEGIARFSETGTGSRIVCTFSDGSTCHYGDPSGEPRAKLTDSLTALSHPERGIACGVTAARMQTLCVNALRNLPVRTFDAAQISHQAREKGDVLTFVPGMGEMLLSAYEQDALPSECNASLAAPATTVAT